MKLIPDSRRGMLWRFALAALVVVAFTATTTAVAGLEQIKVYVNDFNATPSLKDANVTVPNPGNPQTLLLIGSDHRAGTPFSSANTDTMMLVRLDPNSTTINLLSVPRDLEVTINGSTMKLNSAYSLGGPNLLISILKAQVFPGLHVSHIIDVNFGGFQALVNAIGCVYTDVDRRYYNNTAYTDYSSIDIEPGYQKLCGPQALEFVRYRHGDNDIVRNARQQDFLRWAKAQYTVDDVINNRDTLIKIFGEYTQTDHNLHTVDGLINLFNLVAFSAGHTIKQIPFPAILQPCSPGGANPAPCYVTADATAEQQVFKEFMTPTIPSSGGGSGQATGAARHTRSPSAKAAGLIADPADGHAQAVALGRSGFPVYYPRLIVSGSSFCSNLTANCPTGPIPDSYPRAYALHDQRGNEHSAYRMTLVLNPIIGQYYGVEGTSWLNPPILNSPNQTRVINGKTLLLFFNGHHLSLVGWRTSQGAYWVSNTLTDGLTNAQMLGIAASLTRAR